MYRIRTASSKTEKILKKQISKKPDIKNRLDRLKENPRKNSGAHPLHGKLKGKWACWLGSNLRAVYSIIEKQKTIIIEAAGNHNKVY